MGTKAPPNGDHAVGISLIQNNIYNSYKLKTNKNGTIGFETLATLGLKG